MSLFFLFVLDTVRRENGRVLIHCQAGVSRSATITIAYLMYHTTLSMHEAFRFVKSRRAIVSPNFNFMGQLYALEQAMESGEETREVPSPALDLSLPGQALFSPTPAPMVPPTPLVVPPPTPAVIPSSQSSHSLSHVTEKGFKF